MTLDQVRKLLLRKCKPYAAGAHTGFGLTAWCDAHGVAKTHASDFLAGKRNPGTDLLEALGLEWRVMKKLPQRVGCDANHERTQQETNNDK